MPEEGIVRRAHDELLTYEELTRLCGLFSRGGVRKIRITGGEPLVRQGLLPWLTQIAGLPGRPEILLTTNGVLLHRHLVGLREAGVCRINLSLDTLDPVTWRRITRREGFAEARSAVDAILAAGIGLKINVVVQPGLNDGEILDFVELAKKNALTVRFIEPMPFVGSVGTPPLPMSGREILEVITQRWDIDDGAGEYDGVALNFDISGFAGRIGIIEGHSRNFCSSCSRLRIDPLGGLRTCLYGRPVLHLRELLRSGVDDWDIKTAVAGAILAKPVDGRAAAGAYCSFDSMASIGG
jgi:cyclic pyranopterin phosphate synthase